MKPCDDATYARIVTRAPDREHDLIVVTSTRIVCRIGCSARTPLQRNVLIVDTLEQALSAGYRPCKRCRPDRFGPLPDDAATAVLVAQFEKLLADPVAVATGVAGIARRLHVSERQLRRIVRAHFGATPSELLRASSGRAA